MPSCESSSTPHSLSPTSTRPSSTASGNIDQDLDELVDQISLRARVIAHAHKSKLAGQPVSRSFDNLSGLLKTDEDVAQRKARLKQFKFSSDCGLHSGYSELEENAHQVMRKMDTLIHESKKLQRQGQLRPPSTPGQEEQGEDQWEGLEVDMTQSEPNLAGEGSQEDIGRRGGSRVPE